MKVNLEKLTRFFAEKGTVLLLESQSDNHPWSRKSYLAALPAAEISARDNEVSLSECGQVQKRLMNPWKALDEFRQKHANWLFGYLGYDLKNYTERLTSRNEDPIKAPDLYFMVPEFLIEVDRASSEGRILIGYLPPENEIDAVNISETFHLKNLYQQTNKSEYLKRIEEVKHRISEGDFYEMNLSHQLKSRFSGSSLAFYGRMKQTNAVPFGAYFTNEKLTICCQSPERFLRKDGDLIFSQPIKGTSPRGRTKREDLALKEQLIASQKERAENLMIVDLVRNDLSRIARPASVKVPALFDIETFETVHQMVSTVTARPAEENPVEILKACFPMGSMTGAPKISAMKTIEELEDYRRGIYSGAIGYITPGNDFDFNVVIRTAIIKNEKLFYSVGGAITADSTPDDEWEETLVKARGLKELLKERKL